MSCGSEVEGGVFSALCESFAVSVSDVVDVGDDLVAVYGFDGDGVRVGFHAEFEQWGVSEAECFECFDGLLAGYGAGQAHGVSYLVHVRVGVPSRAWGALLPREALQRLWLGLNPAGS